MAAGRIKGITIEIGGDTTKLVSALSKVDTAIKTTQSNLRDIEKALKLDPTNTNLLKDKQLELAKQVEATKEKLDKEKQALDELNAKLDQPFDLDHAEEFQKNAKAAENLKLQIDLDTAALKDLENQVKKSSSIIGQQMQAWGVKMQEVGDKVKGVGQSIANVGAGLTQKITVPLVAAGTVAVSKYAEVDKTMQLTNKTMGNTAEEAELLNKAMSSAAANSTFGMNDAAGAALNFARAGLSAAEAANAMAPAMNLAAGEEGNLDVVSGGLVATINGFGDSFEEAERYADVFAAACNNSALDVDGLSEAMSIAAPIFRTAGKDVEDAALYMGVMANAGIDANVAANSLKTGMARLADPAKGARKAMEEFGITMDNVWNEDGSMKDSVEIQKNLHDAFANLTEQEQMTAAGAIFGKNQMASWLALINTAPAEVDALNASLQNATGTTQEMADAMMGGFGGSIEKLKSSVDVLMTTLGGLMAQYLTPIIEKIQSVVDAFMGLDSETQEHIIKIGAIVAAVGPIILIIGKVIVGVGSLISAIGTISSAIGAIIPVIGAVSAPVLGIVAAIAAVIAIIVLAIKHWDEIKEVTRKVVDAMSEKWEEFKESVSQKWEELKTNVANIVNAMVQKWTEFKESVSRKWEELKTNISNAVNNIKTSIQNKFNEIKNTVVNVVNAMVQKWSEFKESVSRKWEELKTNISNAVNNIKTAVQNKFAEIKTAVVNKVTELKTNAVNAFQNLLTSISNTVSNIKNAIVNGFQNAINFITSLPGQALSWGRDIIDGIVDGIRNAIGRIRNVMSDVASTIASFIHFSEPDEGPLSNFHTYMPDMMRQIAQGIEKGKPQIEKAMESMTSAMVPSLAGTSTSSVDNSTNSVSINVYGAPGQDINELANVIEQHITDNVIRRGVAFA